MSEARLNQSAKEIKARAAEWLERQERAGWSQADQGELDAWLAQSTAHEVAYIRLHSAWERTERLVILRPLAETKSAPRRMSPLLMRVAAAVAVVAMLGATAAYFVLSPRDRTYSTPIGGRETVTFADGTRIELNTNTVLRARMTMDQRIVWLDKGEAFFRVKHDATHPFVVMVGDRRITDLGTQFVVRREPSRLKVAVVQGRVWFDPADRQSPSQSAMLTPGDVATVSENRMHVTHASPRTLAKGLSWRRGVLVFDNTSLADAAAELNRYNSKKLVIADPAIASETIGGTFGTNDIEAFARVARTALGLHVANNGAEMIVFR
jgi:transmembrane sensor